MIPPNGNKIGVTAYGEEEVPNNVFLPKNKNQNLNSASGIILFEKWFFLTMTNTAEALSQMSGEVSPCQSAPFG